MKIGENCKADIGFVSIVANVLTQTAYFSVENGSLKKYLRSMMKIPQVSPNTKEENFAYSRTLFDSFINMVRVPGLHEIFVFSPQPYSGISLVNKLRLPEDGFGFFGWICLEQREKSEEEDKKEAQDDEMCVFSFSAPEGAELELSIVGKQFYYSVR